MLGDLFGTKKAQANLLAGRNAQSAALSSGYTTARADMSGGTTRAVNALSPYMQQGQAGYDRYSNALGVNGRQAQQGVYDDYQADPFQQASRTAGQNMLNDIRARYNAQGQGTQSGNLFNDLNRRAQDLEAQRQQQYLAHLQGLGQTGYGAAGQTAGIYQNEGNALAGYALQDGRDRAGVEGGYYAGKNQIDQQARSQAFQLAGTIAGGVMGGFTPGKSGMSAFGNMAGGFSGKGFV